MSEILSLASFANNGIHVASANTQYGDKYFGGTEAKKPPLTIAQDGTLLYVAWMLTPAACK